MMCVRTDIFSLIIVLAIAQNFQKYCTVVAQFGEKDGHPTVIMHKPQQRTYNGTFETNPSLAMVMQVSPYYNWNYMFTALIISDTCAISRARGIVNTTNYPPILNTGLYRAVFIPRPGCDVQYHTDHIELNNPAFNFPTREHDIAMFQVWKKIKMGSSTCGGTPVKPAWVSCDEHGPPVNYTDCYFTSFGLPNFLGEGVPTPLAKEDISTSKAKIKIISESECESRRLFHEPDATVVQHPKDQVCVSTMEDHSPTCDQDWNGAVFCKYWKQPQGYNYKQYDGENLDDFEDYVAVGHRVYGFSQLFCQANSAAIVLKFGSQTYHQLFNTCGFHCSSSLAPGHKCQGNPPKSLGPVYCIPEKIPQNPYKEQKQYEENNY